MFVRIVKMTFEPSLTDEFQELFRNNREKIRTFEGCEFLELYRDRDHEHIFFTYSYWREEADLEAYRHSELFGEVWRQTKKLFSGKPEAWSVDKVWTSPETNKFQSPGNNSNSKT